MPIAKDPVCGMQVYPANALSVEHNGAKAYFCSQGCASKFQADPTKYLENGHVDLRRKELTGDKAKA